MQAIYAAESFGENIDTWTGPGVLTAADREEMILYASYCAEYVHKARFCPRLPTRVKMGDFSEVLTLA